MNKSQLILLFCILLFSLPGCVTIPVKQATPAIEAQELAADVNFLAQPALKGRQPRTTESQIVRNFLTARFKQYGLVPWPDTNSFEQPFGIGTNVIGVLPGSDPNMAGQIVILSAHYDHLTEKGWKADVGACDNASGVAALLEIAEYLSSSPQRPRRSIAFVAFDCEEMFAIGAFAFTSSDYFDKSKIAAVINVDMLGRDFFGVVPKSLFVIGTESYPTLRDHIISEAGRTKLKVLPIGTTLVGPTGDHIPFETLNIPVLFFTCGFFPDYHKSSDTPEKLNFADIKDSADIAADTTRYLADAESIEKPQPVPLVQKYELETLDYVLTTASANQGHLKLSPKQAEKLKTLSERTHTLLAKDSFSQNDCMGLMTDIITPTLEFAGPEFQIEPNMLACLRAIYISHRTFLIERVRGLIGAQLKRKMPLFGKIERKDATYDLTDDMISFTQAVDGQYMLYVLLPQLEFRFQISGLPFPSGKFGFSVTHNLLRCCGSKEQIADYCVLKWTGEPNDPSLSRAYQKLLNVVTAEDINLPRNQWVELRLNQGAWADEDTWIDTMRKSDNHDLADAAYSAYLSKAAKKHQYLKLLPLVGHLNDKTPVEPNNKCETLMEYAGPFAEFPCIAGLCQNFVIPTPAGWALEKLQKLTGQKFGKNKNTWRKWLETPSKEMVENK